MLPGLYIFFIGMMLNFPDIVLLINWLVKNTKHIAFLIYFLQNRWHIFFVFDT